MFEKEEKKPVPGEEIVIERHPEAEVPYELVQIVGSDGNKRLFTRNVRDAEGEAEQKENIAKQKEKELAEAKEIAAKAKSKVSKKPSQKEE